MTSAAIVALVAGGLLWHATRDVPSADEISAGLSTRAPGRAIEDRVIREGDDGSTVETDRVEGSDHPKMGSLHSRQARGEAKPGGGDPTSGPPGAWPGSFVLRDLREITVQQGGESPVVGDTIYSIERLPEDTCGTFWVQSSDGTVARLAVCNHANGDHPDLGAED